MKLLRNTAIKITKNEDSVNVTQVWFTDENSKPPEIEDKINIPLVIN